jgi:hypothetical protein
MSITDNKVKSIVLGSWIEISSPAAKNKSLQSLDIFASMRQWLDNIEIENAKFAHLLCKYIPTQCPFERKIQIWGRTLIRIPPLCKLNPLYNEVVALRFRAICYLADVCGEDVSAYC